MTQRISTAGFHNRSIAELMARQSQLSRTQTQIASGKRVQTPADDPIAATRIVDLQRSSSQLEQYGRNAIALRNRLGTTEVALTDVGSVLQRVRELAVQANSSALDDSARTSIAAEVRARVQELQGIANRRDATGEYLFAGFAVNTQPFSRGAVGVAYAGDQGVRSLQVAPDQRVADGFSGHDVFMNVPEDNGVFATSVGVHNGAASIDNGRVVNQAAWVRDTYTVVFTATDAWEVRNSANTLVANGTYSSGNAIAFNGGQVVVTGPPAVGDTFVLAPAGRESIFDTIDQFVTTLETAVDDPSGRANLGTGLNAALAQIDQGLTRVLNLRAEIGARISTTESAEDSHSALEVELKSSLSELQDLDYAEAIGRMNQQLTGLQAAQAAYTRISQLSLFDYL
jgi:flagellar hook-associated protein 3 FlgL